MDFGKANVERAIARLKSFSRLRTFTLAKRCVGLSAHQRQILLVTLTFLVNTPPAIVNLLHGERRRRRIWIERYKTQATSKEVVLGRPGILHGRHYGELDFGMGLGMVRASSKRQQALKIQSALYAPSVL